MGQKHTKAEETAHQEDRLRDEPPPPFLELPHFHAEKWNTIEDLLKKSITNGTELDVRSEREEGWELPQISSQEGKAIIVLFRTAYHLFIRLSWKTQKKANMSSNFSINWSYPHLLHVRYDIELVYATTRYGIVIRVIGLSKNRCLSRVPGLCGTLCLYRTLFWCICRHNLFLFFRMSSTPMSFQPCNKQHLILLNISLMARFPLCMALVSFMIFDSFNAGCVKRTYKAHTSLSERDYWCWLREMQISTAHCASCAPNAELVMRNLVHCSMLCN